MGKAKGKSRGLSFLQQARPEAISHLLKFFKESGQHLEPRTRFLISIVTKVINLSPRGLEQYVRRALDEGATPDEIIDAVLCAYPCAGLTRVVDAIDVILDMGLAGFERLADRSAELAAEEAEPGGSEASAVTSPTEPAPSRSATGASSSDSAGGDRWVVIGTRSELAGGGRMQVQINDRWLAVFAIDDDVCVVDNLCPHKSAPLAGGQLSDGVLTCPLHHWQFDVRTGACPTNPGARLGTYEVRIGDDDKILVKL